MTKRNLSKQEIEMYEDKWAKRKKRKAKTNFPKRCRCFQCTVHKRYAKSQLKRLNKQVRLYGRGGNKRPTFGFYTD